MREILIERQLTMKETIFWVVGFVVTMYDSIITTIAVIQEYKKQKHQKSNRLSPK